MPTRAEASRDLGTYSHCSSLFLFNPLQSSIFLLPPFLLLPFLRLFSSTRILCFRASSLSFVVVVVAVGCLCRYVSSLQSRPYPRCRLPIYLYFSPSFSYLLFLLIPPRLLSSFSLTLSTQVDLIILYRSRIGRVSLTLDINSNPSPASVSCLCLCSCSCFSYSSTPAFSFTSCPSPFFLYLPSPLLPSPARPPIIP